MSLFLWILAAVAALVLADQVLLWAERRDWIYWRRNSVGGGAGGGMLGELHQLFSPARHHMVEEQQRQLVLRDDAESGAPPAREIDLASGQVVIHLERGEDGAAAERATSPRDE
ncbi:DUF6191 domain-containing protein [Streptomyces avicenniae]|uniref:DUF6191 domain-containing protein n=1 Tax=Streptomyces avicenniae TaxID=500153 RepID=UPI00167DF7DB|nr:DUF6191 domain-containing protein [Streptomyces avicenniae]